MGGHLGDRGDIGAGGMGEGTRAGGTGEGSEAEVTKAGG